MEGNHYNSSHLRVRKLWVRVVVRPIVALISMYYDDFNLKKRLMGEDVSKGFGFAITLSLTHCKFFF